MKLKILQSYKDVSIFQPTDYYFQFDYPKINLTNKTKYFIFPVVGKQFNALTTPVSASDYEVWGYSFLGEPDATTFLPIFNDPSYPYKAIVPQISIPAGPSGGVAGDNGYRKPADTGYTLSTSGADWTNFKSLVNGMPKGRRVLSANQYWWSDVDIFTNMGFTYYKNTIDGISYAGVSFTTPWLAQNTQDAASSFNAFLTLSQNQGLSFDYVATDNETQYTWWLNGVNSYTGPFGYGSPSNGIPYPKGDARWLSAVASDPRFTTLKHPDTNKTWSREFLQNYGDMVKNDPLQVESSYVSSNGFGWPNVTNVFEPIGFMKDWLQELFSSAEYVLDTFEGAVYRYTTGSPITSNDPFTMNLYNTGVTGGKYFTGVLSTPDPVVLMGTTLTNIKQITVGYGTLLALKNDGTVLPWGQKDSLYGIEQIEGTDAAGNTIRSTNNYCTGQPVQILGVTLSGITQVSLSWDRACGLSGNGSVRCWGYDGANSDVPTGLTGIRQISGGGLHTIALTAGLTAVCWGSNFGPIGEFSGQCEVPASVTSVKQVAAGGYHSMALKTDGTVICWGSNRNEQGTVVNQSVVPVNLTGVTQIAAGDFYSLAVKTDGTVVCWGDNRGAILGTTGGGSTITVPVIATGQSVKILGVTLSNIKTISDNIKNGSYVRALTTATEISWENILAPYIGVTLAGNFRRPADYWTPYGCGESFAAGCGCSWLGSKDIRKPAGYTFSAYSLFHYVVPAWNSVADNWQNNVYLKELYTDTLENSVYNNVKHVYYNRDPVNAEEAVFYQASNIDKELRLPITSSYGGQTYYFPSQKNIVFSNVDILDNRSADYTLYFGIRSGYIKNPETDNERYMFAGYADARTESGCSLNQLVRYPETDAYNSGTTLDINSYNKFRIEICYKQFVDFIKNTRHSHRSDTTLWERFCPWIWYPAAGINPNRGTADQISETLKILTSYWYETNFHLCLHGVKFFQIFEGAGENEYLRLLSQKMLDIWRVISFNSQAQPCSNATGDTTLLVDRLLMEDAFEKYVISGGRCLKTGEYIWRITIPPKYFNTKGIATLNRVGNDPDLPETITINTNIESPENRRGVWIKRLISTRPEYTIVAV